MEFIKYKKGYKYQLVETYVTRIGIVPKERIETDFITLDTNGLLTIKKGYAWDGPSGPTLDTPAFMRGSLIHDALYQLMRLKLISREYKNFADKVLERCYLEDSSYLNSKHKWHWWQAIYKWWSNFRAHYVYNCVKEFGKNAITMSAEPKVITAP